MLLDAPPLPDGRPVDRYRVALLDHELLTLADDTMATSFRAIDTCLDHLLAAIDDGAVAEVGSRRQREDLATTERLARRLDALRLRLLARAERAQVAERTGHTDTGSWVARTTNGDRRPAARDVHLATTLSAPPPAPAAPARQGSEGPEGDLPTEPLHLTRSSLDVGDISAEHAGVIARAMADLPDGLSTEQRRRCESELLRLAASRNPAQLRLAARRVVEQVEPDREAVDAHEDEVVRSEEQRAAEASAFWIKDNRDGTMTGQFTVPWASGMILKKVVDAMTAPRRGRPPARGVARAAASAVDRARTS